MVKFLYCKNRCTTECPDRDNFAMKRICNGTDKWMLQKDKTIETITNEDYEEVEALCENCDSFKPETD